MCVRCDGSTVDVRTFCRCNICGNKQTIRYISVNKTKYIPWNFIRRQKKNGNFFRSRMSFVLLRHFYNLRLRMNVRYWVQLEPCPEQTVTIQASSRKFSSDFVYTEENGVDLLNPQIYGLPNFRSITRAATKRFMLPLRQPMSRLLRSVDHTTPTA